MLQPKKTKYRKYFKPRVSPKNYTKKQTLSQLKCFALVPLQSGYLNEQQIEAARQNIRRKVKRQGRLEIPILTDIAISRKPTAARMGKGKGKLSYWVTSLPAGKPLFLLYGINEEQGLPALRAGANKLPFQFKIYKL